MAVYSDINGFPEAGFPVLSDVSDRVCLNTLYWNPLKEAGFILDVVGNNRLAGNLSLAGMLSGVTSITMNGALSGVSTISASGTATLTSSNPLSLTNVNANIRMPGLNSSIGSVLERVYKGYFKNLDVANTLTVNGDDVALIGDIKRYVSGTLNTLPKYNATGITDSKFTDDGTTPKYNTNTIYHSGIANLPTVDWTAKLMNAASNAGAGGYVSTGDYGGTGSASYHPSGIWANGATNWLYGKNYYNGTQQATNNRWLLENDGSFTTNGLIKAYRYATATNLPAITLGNPGSYSYGIGPDGTNMRIRYGTAALDGSSWNTTGESGIEHYFDGKLVLTGTATLGSLSGYLKGTAGVVGAVSSIPESDISFTNITTGNVSTSKHGYFPKLPTPTGKYLRDDLTWQNVSGGTGVPGGLDKQVQWNDNGSFAGIIGTSVQNFYNSQQAVVFAGEGTGLIFTDLPTNAANGFAICSGSDLAIHLSYAGSGDSGYMAPFDFRFNSGILGWDANEIAPTSWSIKYAGSSSGDAQLGFFNTAPIVKPTITGSKGGNAALTSLLTQLSNLGLITDSTT